jgi:hypothetical protein
MKGDMMGNVGFIRDTKEINMEIEEIKKHLRKDSMDVFYVVEKRTLYAENGYRYPETEVFPKLMKNWIPVDYETASKNHPFLNRGFQVYSFKKDNYTIVFVNHLTCLDIKAFYKREGATIK